MGNPDREVEGAPRKARVGEEGSLERLYHPVRSPSPTRPGSARVEEGRHPWGGWGEGGCRPRVIHGRHLWLRRWAEWGSSGKEGLVKGKTEPSTLGGWRRWASILSTSRCQALSWERGAPRGEDKDIYMVVPRAPSLVGLLCWERVCSGADPPFQPSSSVCSDRQSPGASQDLGLGRPELLLQPP